MTNDLMCYALENIDNHTETDMRVLLHNYIYNKQEFIALLSEIIENELLTGIEYNSINKSFIIHLDYNVNSVGNMYASFNIIFKKFLTNLVKNSYNSIDPEEVTNLYKNQIKKILRNENSNLSLLYNLIIINKNCIVIHL